LTTSKEELINIPLVKEVPVGISNYKNLIDGEYYYVDKTLLIKAFLDERAGSFLITRPRRFGKTLNMSMLYYFFSNQQNNEENKKLFIDKKICSAQTRKGEDCMQFKGEYPTIFISFNDIRPDTLKQAKAKISVKMAQTYQEHSYLADSPNLSINQKAYFQKISTRNADDADVQQSLKILSIYLEKHFNKKVIILLDEYDTPFHAAYTSKIPFHDQLIAFMKDFFTAAFKGNNSLARALLTGILPVALLDLVSSANNIPIRSTLTAEYAEFFGFTEVSGMEIIIPIIPVNRPVFAERIGMDNPDVIAI
jgi:hemerythrin